MQNRPKTPGQYKNSLFRVMLKSQEAAGISSSEELLTCPLCWELKSIDECSLEHVVPGCIDGEIVTLTCRNCNSSSGAQYDYSLGEELKLWRTFRYSTPIRRNVLIGGNRVTADISCNTNIQHWTIDIVGQQSNPKAVEAARPVDGESAKVSFSISLPDPKLTSLASLKVGYLASVLLYGYKWATLPFADEFRSYLSGSKILNLPLTYLDPKLSLDLPSASINFGDIIGYPFILFPVGREPAFYRMVLMPKPNQSFSQIAESIDYLKKMHPTGENIDIEFHHCVTRDSLNQPYIKVGKNKSRKKR